MFLSDLSYRFTQIAVDPQVKTPGGKTYDVLFIGTDNGKVIKAVNAESADSHQKVSPVVIEEIQAFPQTVPVRGIKVVRASQAGDGLEDGRLVVIADSQVQALRLHRCYSDRILSCSECVALQDPYCAWDKVEGKCRALVGPASTDASRFLQSVATGTHTSCPPSKSLNKDAGSVGAISANQNKFPQDSMIPNKDNPGGEIINIMQDEEQDSSGPEVSAADTPPPQYSVETLVMAVVAGALAALFVGFVAGYLCGRKCRKDEDDNLPYPDTEYEYFEQRQNVNSRLAPEPKLLPQEEVTYAEPVLVPQPPKLQSPKGTMRKPPPTPTETLFQFPDGYGFRGGPRGDNFGTLRSHQGDAYRRNDGFATTRSVKKVYL
ncbi:semaphorin-1a [Lasius niger]|uniref:Semaphorin-1A n=1 Tax=Lasius niger TaxID=67767 RepID=A0A0J7L1S9_LASNI|nr:semaphorin-1a [Lasius niger]